MRVTVALDDDVVAALERRRRELKRSLKQEVNDLLRAGLKHMEQEQPKAARFQVEPLDAGELLLDNVDDISAILAIAEGEDYR